MQKHPECLVDTNAVLRHILDDIPEQVAILKPIFDGIRSGDKAALLLESVLVECVYILKGAHYKVPKTGIVEKLDGVLRYPGFVNSDKADLREALKLYGESSISIVDCILVAKSRIAGLVAISFDEDLQKLKGKVN
jgi:predicted nucleic-acid-binding protein